MSTLWKTYLLALVFLAPTHSSAGSPCRPRPPGSTIQPSTEGPSSSISETRSRSTLDQFVTIELPLASASETEGTDGKRSGQYGATTALMSYHTDTPGNGAKTGSLLTEVRPHPEITSWSSIPTEFGSFIGSPTSEPTETAFVSATQIDTRTEVVTAPRDRNTSQSDTSHVQLPWFQSTQTSASPEDTISHSSSPFQPTRGLSNSQDLPIHTSLPESSNRAISTDLTASGSETVTSPISEISLGSAEHTDSIAATSTNPSVGQETTAQDGSQSANTTTGVLADSSNVSLPHTPQLSVTSNPRTSTESIESQDDAATSTGNIDTASLDPTTSLSGEISASGEPTGSSLSGDDSSALSGTHTAVKGSQAMSEVSTSESDTIVSSDPATNDQSATTDVSSEQTRPNVSETHITSGTESGGLHNTSQGGHITDPIEATTGAAVPKSTAISEEPVVTSHELSETPIQQTEITDTDGQVVTWSATRDPQHTDNFRTVTQTDDDGGLIVMFPGGWKWSPIGGGKKGGPTPTADPTLGDDKNEDPDDEDDDDRETCTSSAPPKCTLTMSYYTQEDGVGTRQVDKPIR